MGKWSEFNRKFNMTGEDWKEWHATKHRYKNGCFFSCEKCGCIISTSPLITFLILKGKIKRILCSKCRKESREK